MADIQYLNYGDLQIELLALLNNLANLVLGYVLSQPWSRKRKEKFMSAYSDIMNRGLLGASNNTGQWMIDVNGEIDLGSMDRKDREMYLEAAYFIQQLMAGLPTKASEEEKKEDKSKLPVFDFNTDFITHVNNNMSGGRPLNIGYGDEDLWNYLDERDPNTGIRGRKNRAAKLAELLESYKAKVGDGSKYNFEGSPYTDINDFNSKVDRAIAALKTDSVDDDREALLIIGLNAADWFNNGSGDPSGKKIKLEDGTERELTFGELGEYDKLLAELKLKEQEEKDKLNKLNAYKNTVFFTRGSNKFSGKTTQQLKEKYLTSDNLITALLNYSQKPLKSLTPDEYSEIYGAYKYMAKDPIDDKLFRQLQSSSSGLYRNAAPNRFRKIKGIDGYVWDTAARQIIHVLNRELHEALKNIPADLFAGVQTLQDLKALSAKEREQYLKSSKEGLTSAEWEELASIGFDIASIVDPEMISAGTLALAGSGLRHHALASLPGGMSTSDKWWQAADYGLSILGSIPVLGDAALAARAVNNLKKAIVPLGIVMAGANVPQAAKAAYNKVVNGLDLTILDWRAIGAVLTAAVGMGRGRQISKRAEALRRTGGGGQKTITEGTVKTDKGEIKGLSEKTTKDLQKSFRKAGNDNEAKTKALRENAEVQTKAQELGIKLEEASITSESSWRNRGPKATRKTPEITTTTRTESTGGGSRVATLRAMAEYNRTHGWLARKGLAEQDWVFRHTGGYNSSTPHTGLWLSMKNYFKKSEWDNFGNRLTNNTTSLNTTSANTSSEATTSSSNNRLLLFDRAAINRYKDILKGKFSNREIKEGSFKFGDGKDISVNVKKTPTGWYDIYINGKKTEVKNDLSKTEVKKEIASLVQSYRRQVNTGKSKDLKISTKDIGKILQDLKRKGWLKQGGKITDAQIDNFLKHYK